MSETYYQVAAWATLSLCKHCTCVCWWLCRWSPLCAKFPVADAACTPANQQCACIVAANAPRTTCNHCGGHNCAGTCGHQCCRLRRHAEVSCPPIAVHSHRVCCNVEFFAGFISHASNARVAKRHPSRNSSLCVGGIVGLAATRHVLAAPSLFAVGPALHPVEIASRAVIWRTSRRAATTVVLTAPNLFAVGPTRDPIAVPSVAVVW
mmetsp:Transcript_54179/g.104729  ORF Transcript_54179/g.104729 Transcript_54179/m.104729 type:complete len:207 (-) Transcript_54179:1178-1798(-)